MKSIIEEDKEGKIFGDISRFILFFNKEGSSKEKISVIYDDDF